MGHRDLLRTAVAFRVETLLCTSFSRLRQNGSARRSTAASEQRSSAADASHPAINIAQLGLAKEQDMDMGSETAQEGTSHDGAAARSAPRSVRDAWQPDAAMTLGTPQNGVAAVREGALPQHGGTITEEGTPDGSPVAKALFSSAATQGAQRSEVPEERVAPRQTDAVEMAQVGCLTLHAAAGPLATEEQNATAHAATTAPAVALPVVQQGSSAGSSHQIKPAAEDLQRLGSPERSPAESMPHAPEALPDQERMPQSARENAWDSEHGDRGDDERGNTREPSCSGRGKWDGELASAFAAWHEEIVLEWHRRLTVAAPLIRRRQWR